MSTISLEKELEQYNFPTELGIKFVQVGTQRSIEFTLPVNLPSDVKGLLFKEDFYKNSNLFIGQKPKANKVYQIKGGKTETKIMALLFILKNVKVNDKPVFEADYIPPKSLPEFLCFWDNNQNSKPLNQTLDKKNYKLGPLLLTTEEVYLLVGLYNPPQAQDIPGLKQDENHDPQIFQLNIPTAVNVCIKYNDFDKYEMTFDNKQIHEQIKNQALPKIKAAECIIATFSKTDPIDADLFLKSLNLPEAYAVFIPDETTAEEDFATTVVEIFIPQLNDEVYAQIEQKLKEYYNEVELAVCKKCQLFFCPKHTEDKCMEYYHKGKQIPFESGQMEEVVYDEEEEPYILVNYTCCGECPKDEPPMECGKRENGFHEIDEKEGIISKLNVERGKPGNITFK